MGIFDKGASLVSVWQKIKLDAEKVRGGKKPGGKMGFEPLIKSLEAAMKSKTPELGKIKAGIAALRIDMNRYKATLDPVAEKGFINGITAFVKLVTDLEQAAEGAIRLGAGNAALVAKLTDFARVNAVMKGFTEDLDVALKELAQLTTGDIKVGKEDLKPIHAAYMKAKRAMDGAIKTQPVYERAFAKLSSV